ncbi:hypothetical protein PRCB_03140 [Pantoea rodasii]|uniref:Uncharacterized protein n=1 Tax=Pantoea rodasii TaxID=1076549 RepID=A0A2M9WHK3_9GAMM|nr:hypothetical protein [Pantoea rodasii]ORM62217.1 hypothetical protein HA45_18055 [Pantoea rodasii]PJZ07023.1 hypothetical protein PRCB_03140 [Pantoea rodasii]
MSEINITGNIQKAAMTQLRSKEVVQIILASVYTGPTREDATAAATDFVNHLTLHNEASVRTACGDNFDRIQSAFAEQANSIAEKLADAVIDADKSGVESQIQTYVDNLQYKHSIDNGQDAANAKQPAEAV